MEGKWTWAGKQWWDSHNPHLSIWQQSKQQRCRVALQNVWIFDVAKSIVPEAPLPITDIACASYHLLLLNSMETLSDHHSALVWGRKGLFSLMWHIMWFLWENISHTALTVCVLIIILKFLKIIIMKYYFDMIWSVIKSAKSHHQINSGACLYSQLWHLYKTDTWCWSLPFFSHFTVTILSIRQTPL